MRRKLLRDQTDEELCLGIRQRMGLPFLVPVALERLETIPLASEDFYERALLKNALLAADSSNLGRDQLSCL